MACPLLFPEFAPQSGVILTWPHAQSDWRDGLADIERVYRDISLAISRHERLLVICYDRLHRQHVNRLLDSAGVARCSVRYVIATTNDTWVRDYGPLSVLQETGPVLLDFVFDGWGGKYPAALDDRVCRQLCAAGVFGDRPCQRQALVLEGGSIDTDGAGSLLTTTRCLLGAGRNPGTDKVALETLFRERLGIDRIMWLDYGELRGDDTDAHVDMLARFCSPDTIAYTQCTDPSDEHHAVLAAMEQQLQTFRTGNGAAYTLIPLPLPRPVFNSSGQRLPASYANFLIINGAVLVPVYNDPADAVALDALTACFPGREVVAIDSLSLVQQNGSLHCATMQLPEGVLV